MPVKLSSLHPSNFFSDGLCSFLNVRQTLTKFYSRTKAYNYRQVQIKPHNHYV